MSDNLGRPFVFIQTQMLEMAEYAYEIPDNCRGIILSVVVVATDPEIDEGLGLTISANGVYFFGLNLGPEGVYATEQLPFLFLPVDSGQAIIATLQSFYGIVDVTVSGLMFGDPGIT